MYTITMDDTLIATVNTLEDAVKVFEFLQDKTTGKTIKMVKVGEEKHKSR